MFGPITTHAYRTALSLFGLVLLVSLAACGNISRPLSQSKTVTPSPATTLPPARHQIIEHFNMAYGPLTAEKLDLCEPVDAPSPRPGIIQGTKDSLVPPSQAMELYQALQHNHVPVQYLSYNGGHAGEGAPQQRVISVLAQTLAFLVGSLHP